MASPSQNLPSLIQRVVLHPSGARVIRQVDLAQYESLEDSEDFTIQIEGITAHALANSFKASLDSQHVKLISVQNVLSYPTNAYNQNDKIEKIESLGRTLEDKQTRLNHLQSQHKKMASLNLVPGNVRSWRDMGPGRRIESALVMDGFIDARLAQLDELIHACQKEIRDLQREQKRLNIEHAQRSTADDGGNQPHWNLQLHCTGAGSIESLQVEYVVMEAAWWPLYTLHLTDAGKKAKLLLEAMVAQDTKEDWKDVKLSLSTADMMVEAALPKLPALKLGKVQPAKPSGYREPPKGIDRLFLSYDDFQKRTTPTSTLVNAPVGQSLVYDAIPEPVMPLEEEAGMAEDWDDDFSDLSYGASEDGLMLEDEVAFQTNAPAPMMMERSMPKSRSLFGGFGSGAPAPGAPMPAQAPQSRARKSKKKEAPPQQIMPEPQGIKPGDEWKNFNDLIMSGRDAGSRGQLQSVAKHRRAYNGDLSHAKTRATEMKLISPSISRGHYDHRYDPEGLVKIPSDAAAHRIDVMAAQGQADLWWRTVPSKEAHMYRMAQITNPLEAPLLSGPADIFVEGSFLLNTAFEHIDRGGVMVFGLGQDDRMKVARNTTMEEHKEGLLNNKSALEHTVNIELTSGHGFATKVEVIDRVPVTNDDDIDIKLTHMNPSAQDFDQKEEGKVIDGGKRWWINLKPGQTQTITFNYTITISAKQELIGGNRRE